MLIQEILLLVFLCCYTLQTKCPTDLDNSEFRRWIEKMHVYLHVRPPFCDVSSKSREQSACFNLLTVTNTCLQIVHKSNTSLPRRKKLMKKLGRIETSSICRQQFANVFADSFCAVHTHQLEFANTSLPTLVCRVKAAQNPPPPPPRKQSI